MEALAVGVCCLCLVWLKALAVGAGAGVGVEGVGGGVGDIAGVGVYNGDLRKTDDNGNTMLQKFSFQIIFKKIG